MKLPRYRLLTLFIAIGVIAVVLRVVIGWVEAAKRTHRTVRALEELRDPTGRPHAVSGLAVGIEFDDSPPAGTSVPSGRSLRGRPWHDYLWHSVASVMATELDRDEDLERICELRTVKQLTLQHGQFSANARGRLTALKNLRYLCVSETEFDDAEVRTIFAALPRLEVLYLNQPGLSEEGLQQLATLKNLRELCVVLDWEFYGGREQNEAELQRLLPRCRVHLESDSRQFWGLWAAAWTRARGQPRGPTSPKAACIARQ